jgi:hypothetical protein
MENENEVMEEERAASVDGDAVAVTVKKKRTSKTWLVTYKTASGEELVAKITGCPSGEEAIARFEASKSSPSEEFVSVRPLRAFK